MTDELTICVDENIPLASEAFGRFGPVRALPGRSIEAADVQSADVLLVRSVTPVGPELLAGSSVRFVGSATIGTDHVDRAFLTEQGIAFAHAPGSNADSVADYVIAALLTLCMQHRRPLSSLTLGIVGCGNIGGRLARRLPSMGVSVLLNDPPRQESEAESPFDRDFEPLERVLDDADVVTLHTPLTAGGAHPTRHLFDDSTLHSMQPGAWLLNTSRGPVVDNEALREAMDDGPIGAAVLDVWEGEPTPDPDLVRRVDLATPHIAGYAIDGKVRGTKMLYDALCDSLGADKTWDPSLAPEHPDALRCTPPDARLPQTDYLHALARQAYAVKADDDRMRGLLDRPREERGAYFSRLRKTYPTRREFQQFSLPASAVPDRYAEAVSQGLQMSMQSIG